MRRATLNNTVTATANTETSTYLLDPGPEDVALPHTPETFLSLRCWEQWGLRRRRVRVRVGNLKKLNFKPLKELYNGIFVLDSVQYTFVYV